jgi:hypothetical protein
MDVALEVGQRLGTDPPLRTPKRSQHCQHLDFQLCLLFPASVSVVDVLWEAYVAVCSWCSGILRETDEA